ncbi:MAG: hypothetical protein AMXMBFR34_35720 [Myxococcaceae bacterium]
MAINIKNREAERLLNALARKTRMGKTEIVLDLLRTESARQARLGGLEERRRRIKAIARKAARKAARVKLTPDQIVGYNAAGLPG